MENTKHHRLPKSLCGKDLIRNISHVPQLHHRAWHNLFGNLSAPQIAHQLCRLFPDYHFLVTPRVPMKNIVLSQNTGTAKSRRLIDKSIQILWGDMGMTRIVDSINERWLDPDFRLIHLKIISP